LAFFETREDDGLGEVAGADRDGGRDGLAVHDDVNHRGKGLAGVDDPAGVVDGLLGEFVDPPVEHGLAGHDEHVDEVLDGDLGGGAEPREQRPIVIVYELDLGFVVERAVLPAFAFEPDPLDGAGERVVAVGVDVDGCLLIGLDLGDV
jgi:hypothetical protein